MEKITLSTATWTFDPGQQLGREGGFGAVFAGFSPDGLPVAIKRLKKALDNDAHRELTIARALSGKDFPHVMRVFDSGQDAASGRYFIVMPRAERSLQDYLDANGPLPERQTIPILQAIAAGLRSVSDLVHRDMKPDNVLLHDGRWKIADFGIARIAASATSARTLKEFMTPDYAAPEQWRGEHATNATDVYALGCIAYSLLTGAPPFPGPETADYQRQHKQELPRPLIASAMLSQTVSSCLLKSPLARPPLERLVIQLQKAGEKLMADTRDPLAEAGAQIAADQAAKEAEHRRTNEADQARRMLAADGVQCLKAILGDLYDEICETAVPAERSGNGVRLGQGGIKGEIVYPMLAPQVFGRSLWKDVVVGAALTVYQNDSNYPGRSANLWYGDIDGTGTYAWWEASYWTLGASPTGFEPRALIGKQGLAIAVQVVSNITSGTSFAHRPRKIDGEHRDDFVKRWKDWLAQASHRKLRKPSMLPEERF